MDNLIVPIDDLVLDSANARSHPERNVREVRGSLKQFGAARSIVIDRNDVVRAGNATLEAARELGFKTVRVIETDGKELIAVKRNDWEETAAVAYGIKDNRAGEFAKWNNDVLVPLLESFPDDMIEVVGFTPDERDAIFTEYREVGRGDAEGDGEREEVIPSLEQRYGPLPPPSGLKAPFPWFGGKSRIAPLVWKRFGAIGNYIEPFAGSLAVLLDRPQPFEGAETINDLDGLVANFWRALKADPGEVARHADWPVIENDLHARHAWLVERKDSLQARLEGDPDYFDAKIAGWWVWGICSWIGGGWCDRDGPWKVVTGPDETRMLVKGDGEDEGISRRRPQLGSSRGINRQMSCIGDQSRGISRKRPHLDNQGQGINRVNGAMETCEERTEFLLDMMRSLADRIRRVRVCCGDWTRICGGKSGDALGVMMINTDSCGVFLDPPYADTAGRDQKIYRQEDLQVAHAVRDWAVAHGDDERFRIALCGYEGEHEMPPSWECVEWKAQGGMANMNDDEDSAGKENARRERIWFSPHCSRD